MLPTPTAHDGKGSGPSQLKRKSLTLQEIAHLLPTCTTADAHASGGSNPSNVTLTDAVVRTDFGKVENPRHLTLLATPRASDGEKGGPNQCNSRGGYDALPGQVHPDRFGKYAAAIEQWERITNTKAPDPTEPTGRGGQHRLSPAFAAWMMGLHKFHITDEGNGLSRKAQLKLIGNAVVPHQASHAVSGLLARAVSE